MTDVEPKNNLKRKNLGGKQSFQKKPKLENGPITQKFGFSKKQKQRPKNQKNSHKNGSQKGHSNQANKNVKKDSQLIDFKSTSQIEQPEKKVTTGLQQQSNNQTADPDKKPKKDRFFDIKQKLNSTNNEKQEAVAIIENKIKAIESRGKLTNTAIRNLRELKKFKKLAEGGEMKAPPAKNSNTKSKSAKRRERRIAASKKAAEVNVKPETVKPHQKIVKKKESESETLENCEDETVVPMDPTDAEESDHEEKDGNEEELGAEEESVSEDE